MIDTIKDKITNKQIKFYFQLIIYLFNILIRALGSHTIVHVYNKNKLQNLDKLIKNI